MIWKRFRPYILAVALVEAVGILAGLLTREGARYFSEFVTQPPLSPPAVVFPIVWSILYALMGISIVRIWMAPDSPGRRWSINWFVIQLALNFFWPLIFFNARAYGLAAVWVLVLWVVVLLMILKMRKVDMPATWLQVPYLIWLTFATYLAFGVWLLNG